MRGSLPPVFLVEYQDFNQDFALQQQTTAVRPSSLKIDRSIRSQLVLLSMGIVFPTLLFVGVLVWRFASSEQSRIEEEARGLSHSLAVALDREIVGVLMTLEALGTSPSLQTGDFPAFYAQISEIKARQGIHISLRNVTGQTILTTRAPLGTAVPVPTGLAEVDKEVLRTSAPKVTNIFLSATVDRPVFQIVAAPILVAGTPTYLLGASIDPDYLAVAIQKEKRPPGWVGSLIDGNGIVVARTEGQGRYAGKLASSDFRAHSVGDAGSFYGSNVADIKSLIGYSRSGLVGWLASVNIESYRVGAPLRQSLIILFGLGCILTIFATVIALFAGRRINGAIFQLRDAAEAIGRGTPVGEISTLVTEINEVGLTLGMAAQQLQERARERDDAEASVRDREARLRLVIEGAKDYAIFTTDPQGAITTWSAGAAAIFGWTAEEMIGHSASILSTPEDLSADVDSRELSIADDAGFAPDERWHLCRDGNQVYMSGSVRPLPPDAEGRGQGFIKVARDETERRQTDLALRELTETLEAQVEQRTRERDRMWRNSRDLQVVINKNGFVEAISPAVVNVLGQGGHEIIGRSVFEFILSEDEDALRTIITRIKIDETTHFESKIQHKDGSLRCISWLFAVEAGRVYASGRDVSAQKDQEEALLRIEEQLRQSQKMEAVGQLTGGLAHDFNNLLTSITGSLEILEGRLTQGRTNDAVRYINAAQAAAKRAAALTHRLLAFSRQQTLEPKPTDMNRLVAGIDELIRRTIGPEITMELVGADGLWTTMVDRGQLENALLNLCINARDAMPHGGKLTIETANRWLDEHTARDRDLSPGQYVSLCVSDNGTGMSRDIVDRAFDPFFTTKPIGMGTGLGLSMIHGFAKQSGGQVRIYSELGKGTMVCLYLQRYAGAAGDMELQATMDAAPRAEHGETVLVVDDEPTVRMLIREVLEDLGYTALEAADGATGLKVLQSTVRLDLLVTDVGLPGGMNGRQMADAARIGRPGLKVLFITGYAENAVLSHGHLDPGMHILTKPFGMKALGSRIKDLIAGR